MKKSLLASYVFLVFVAYLSFVFFSKTYHVTEVKLNGLPYSSGNNDDRNGRLEQEQMKLMDPVTKKIPNGIFKQEQEFAKTLPNKSIKRKGKYDNSIQSLTWTERGPNNIGGRTRALGIDVRTGTSPNITIIAGGVSGGIWKSTDDGLNWSLKTSPAQLHNATCIVQDTRSGHEDTWYVGTGEGLGNSASGGGSASFSGGGIFKSTDNGENWTLLASTSTGDPRFDSDFDYVHKIVIDPTSGYVYACAGKNIYKSTDGGTNWTKKTDNYYGFGYIPSDVAITSAGVLYVALNNYYSVPALDHNLGILRSSDDGENWVDITSGVTDFPTKFRRGVIDIASANENIVYFLLSNVTSTGAVTNYHQLWKYSYLSGDGSGVGGTWENRGGNLPDHAGGDLSGNDPFDSQGGYDLFVISKPDDANFLIIGGTNLYYSNDAFATNGNFVRIGGYAAYNTYGKYTNHHPDLHAGVFRPGSNLVYYSGDDGGIQRTEDVTASTVSWTKLNNSYNVTQFYSVSLAPESGSDLVLAGAQDNGSILASTPGTVDWTEILSGDGTIVNIAPQTDDRYYPAYQNGGIYRMTRSRTNATLMTPSGINVPLFVNPVVIDKNNSSLMYCGGGDNSSTEYAGVWRNNNALNATTTTGWSFLSGTGIASDPGNSYYPQVSAIGLSQSTSANILYFGTSKGQVKKVTNSNATPIVTDVTGSSFPSDAYVSCIGVDPTNSDKAIVAFSNYNVQSLWYTSDGGITWTDIEGNLSGSTGPSIRWVSIFDVSGTTHYFLATSIGVYFTTTLDGSSTVWSQETASATTIGNVVCDMLDWRSADNTLAVATHGRGVFTTQISAPLPVEITSFTATSNGSKVVLNWQTATKVNNYGFEIQRQNVTQIASNLSNEDWETIGFIQGSGNSNSPKSYEFVDESPLSDSAEYRLKQIDTDGCFTYYDETVQVAGYSTTDVNDANVQIEYSLSQNYPNPFNPTTQISYEIPENCFVNLVVYNSIGQKVVELVNEQQTKGKYSVQFDASNPDGSGRGLTSGVYIYKLQVGKFSTVKKMLLMK